MQRVSAAGPVAATLAAVLVCGCAETMLRSDERARVCSVAVEDRAGPAVFHKNPMFDPVGGPALGAAGGIAGLFVFPPLAIAAPATGIACGAAAAAHPDGETALQNALRSADRDALGRALEGDFAAARAGCARPAAGSPATVAPDLRVEIERIDYGMICPGDYAYWIEVKWRTVAPRGERTLGEATTRCTLRSSRTMEAWLADPACQRTEVERALAAIGRRLAAEMLADETPGACSLVSNEAGEVELQSRPRGGPPAAAASQ